MVKEVLQARMARKDRPVMPDALVHLVLTDLLVNLESEGFRDLLVYVDDRQKILAAMSLMGRKDSKVLEESQDFQVSREELVQLDYKDFRAILAETVNQVFKVLLVSSSKVNRANKEYRVLMGIPVDQDLMDFLVRSERKENQAYLLLDRQELKAVRELMESPAYQELEVILESLDFEVYREHVSDLACLDFQARKGHLETMGSLGLMVKLPRMVLKARGEVIATNVRQH